MARDEVDALIDAWQRERPDLPVGPLAVLSRVTRLARLLDRARREAFAEHDLDLGDFDVLAALRRSGDPYQLSAGALGASTLVTSGTVTHRIDRLVVRGLVERLPDPQDGRGVLVRLSAQGKQRVDAALASLLQQEHDLLSTLSAEEQTALAGLLRSLLHSVESDSEL
ncbi:MAG: MarR family transcriptional regulator [Actinobacteria bacterium]|nr:MarR family transcriptional regulator [Actinomycetota bacterium]